MKRRIIFTIIGMSAMIWSLRAQQPGEVTHVIIDGVAYPVGKTSLTPKLEKELRINWRPEQKTHNRYILGFKPFSLVNRGLKVNFEIELGARAGNWLQLELGGHLAPWYDRNSKDTYKGLYEKVGYSDGGYSTFISGFNDFQKLTGGNISVGYKYMFSDNGWYINPVASFNFYNVFYYDYGFVATGPDADGMVYFTGEYMMKNTKFYKPSFSFNMGKHFAFSRLFFLDAYMGLGYANSRYKSEEYNGYREKLFDDGIYSFGYRGLYFSGGIRLSFLLGK